MGQWRNGRRAALRTQWVIPMGVQIPPAPQQIQEELQLAIPLLGKIRKRASQTSLGFRFDPAHTFDKHWVIRHQPFFTLFLR